MQRATATADHRRMHPAWCARVLAALLLSLAVASAAGAAPGPRFDWRARGVLFRVVPGDAVAAPAPAAAPADASAAATAAAMIEAASELAATGLEAAPQPSYLFATIHYGDVERLSLHVPRLQAQVRSARLLVNEVDGNEPWRPEYEPYRLLPRGQRLSRLIGRQAFERLVALLPGDDAATLDGLKPWVAMSLLENVGATGDKTIDALVQDWARQAGVRTLHLENLVEQLAALDCVPAEEYAIVLAQRLGSGWSFAEEAERTSGYYRDRDLPAWLDEIDRLPGLDAEGVPVERRARHCLIEARNARWLPVLEKQLREGGCFVAVGAIHLTGAEGLLAQLDRRGFIVTVEPW